MCSGAVEESMAWNWQTIYSWVIVGVILPLFLAAAGCSEPAPGPGLVISYATCTVNRDFLPPYISEVSYTPALAEFARKATVFVP